MSHIPRQYTTDYSKGKTMKNLLKRMMLGLTICLTLLSVACGCTDGETRTVVCEECQYKVVDQKCENGEWVNQPGPGQEEIQQ